MCSPTATTRNCGNGHRIKSCGLVRLAGASEILSTDGLLDSEVPLDDTIRDRVIFLGGKAAGVDCPTCDFRSRDVDLDTVRLTDISCPECGRTILTEGQKSQLRQAGKL